MSLVVERELCILPSVERRIAALGLWMTLVACGAKSGLETPTTKPEPPEPCVTNDDCTRGVCVDQRCRTACSQSGKKLLASSPGATFLALGTSDVFWVDPLAGALRKTPKVGGAIDTLAPTQGLGGIAVDASHVYFADGNSLKRVPIAGGTVSTLAVTEHQIWQLALDDSYVYWSNTIAGSPLLRVPKAGGAPEFLSTALEDRPPIAVDASALFWSESTGVWRVTKTGGLSANLGGDALGPGSRWLALDESFAYAIECGIVMRVPKIGGSGTLLDNVCTSNVGGLAFDGTKLFWTVDGSIANSVWGNPTPAVFSLPKAGGNPSVLVRAGANGVAPPGAGIAVDDECVYFAERSDVPGLERGIWQLSR